MVGAELKKILINGAEQTFSYYFFLLLEQSADPRLRTFTEIKAALAAISTYMGQSSQ